MTIDESIAKMISDATAPILSKVEAQNKVLVDLATTVREKDEDMGKKIQGILDWIAGHKDPTAPPPSSPPPSSPPPTTPPPSSPPPTTPPPTVPPPAVPRARADVTRIFLEELAKQTSFIPGGGDITDPNKAVQLWTTNLINNYNALTIPEASLRSLITELITPDVKNGQWDKNYPPVFPGVTVTGTADMPK